MGLIQLTHERRPDLLNAARNAIARSLDSAGLMTVGPTVDERDFVAHLVLGQVPGLVERWQQALGPTVQLEFFSVYCHARPQVDIAGGGRCELGDILWCHFHTDAKRHETRTAALQQVKKATRVPHRLRKGELTQLTLYRTWPPFDFYQWREEDPHRHVRPDCIRRGAEYVLVAPDATNRTIVGAPYGTGAGCCVPDEQLVVHQSLASRLVGLLSLTDGDPFDKRGVSPQGSDWSRMIWDLIDYGLVKAFTWRQAGYVSQPRYSGTVPAKLLHRQSGSPTVGDRMRALLGGPSEFELNLVRAESGDSPPSSSGSAFHDDEPPRGISIVALASFDMGEVPR